MSHSTIWGTALSFALSDALTAPVCLAVNGLLAWTSWRASRGLFPGDRWFQHLGHACLIAYATIVLAGTLLGTVGLLLPWVYVSLVGLLALGAGAVLERSRSRLPAPGPSGEGLSRWPGGGGELFFAAVWGLVGAFWVCHTVIYGVLRFPTEWDTLMYHLPFVDHWVQKGTLYAPECHLWSNPGNNELIALWLVGPFSGDFYFSPANLPGALLMACGALELGRRIGLSLGFRHLAALAVVTHQMIQAQLQGAGNDVAAAGLFLCCLGYVLRYAARARRADRALGVTALGLLAGTKYYALGYALLAALLGGALIARHLGPRAAARAGAHGLGAMTLFGGYWYLRNALVTGTPLYPFGARTAGDTLADVYPAVWESTFVGNRSPELLELAMAAVWDVAGPCHWIALLSLPLAASWVLARSARGPGPAVLKTSRAALALGALAAVGIWAVTPFAVESYPGTLNQMHWKYTPFRYGLCPLSLCVLVFCAAVSDLARALGHVARRALAGALGPRALGRLARAPAGLAQLAFAAALAYQWDNQDLHNSSDELPIALKGLWDAVLVSAVLLVNAVTVALLLTGLTARPRLMRALTALLFAGALGASATFTAYRSGRWHRDFVGYYDSTALGRGVFRELVGRAAPGETIYVLDERYYPFFGSARQFRVVQPSPTQSAVRWYPSHSHESKLIIVRAEVQFKWTDLRRFIADRPDLFQVRTTFPSGHIVYVPAHKK